MSFEHGHFLESALLIYAPIWSLRMEKRLKVVRGRWLLGEFLLAPFLTGVKGASCGGEDCVGEGEVPGACGVAAVEGP